MLTAPWVDQRCVSLLSSLSTELSSVLLPGACVPTVRRVDASRLSSSTSVDLSCGFPCFCPVIRPWTLSLLHAGANSAIQPLEEIWQEETYFFRKRGIEMKISALRALKSIGTGEARQSLSRAARQGDQETSAEARRLLRGGVKGSTA